jgi:hypothetical protein
MRKLGESLGVYLNVRYIQLSSLSCILHTTLAACPVLPPTRGSKCGCIQLAMTRFLLFEREEIVCRFGALVVVVVVRTHSHHSSHFSAYLWWLLKYKLWESVIISPGA